MSDKNDLWARYQHAVGSVDRIVNFSLGALGAFVARRPVLTIVVSAIFALACTSGLVLIGDRIKTESDKLWYVPGGSLWTFFDAHGLIRIIAFCANTDRLQIIDLAMGWPMQMPPVDTTGHGAIWPASLSRPSSHA